MAESEYLTSRLTVRQEREQLHDFLLTLHRFLMSHPQASRELIASLIEEGRRFAQTPEGQAWMDSLKDTELVKKVLMVWDAFALDVLLETGPTITPSNWLDMIVATISNPDLERILQMLVLEEVGHGKVRIA